MELNRADITTLQRAAAEVLGKLSKRERKAAADLDLMFDEDFAREEDARAEETQRPN